MPSRTIDHPTVRLVKGEHLVNRRGCDVFVDPLTCEIVVSDTEDRQALAERAVRGGVEYGLAVAALEQELAAMHNAELIPWAARPPVHFIPQAPVRGTTSTRRPFAS